MTEEPGNDSGCTAVVALLRGEIFVYSSINSKVIMHKGHLLFCTQKHFFYYHVTSQNEMRFFSCNKDGSY